jgi:hypothetical protein
LDKREWLERVKALLEEKAKGPSMGERLHHNPLNKRGMKGPRFRFSINLTKLFKWRRR